ncbi:MAG: hypothetical protein CMP63_04845 [Flavobacteriales bacterium]|nr:hypothetical protein [Flavobacteriales bacterium]
MNTKLLLIFVFAVFLQYFEKEARWTFSMTNNSSKDVHVSSHNDYLEMVISSNSKEKFEIIKSHYNLAK